MNIIDVINDIQIDKENNINLFIEKCYSNNLSIIGLQDIYPHGIPKGQSFLIYGDSESGKSLLSLNLVNKNPNLTFAYVDTHMQIHNHFNNMLLLRSNLSSDILSFFRYINENLIDVIILDDISYVSVDNDDNRANSLKLFLSQLYQICVSKGIVLILLSTINGQGNMYMNNNIIMLHNSGSILRLNPTTLSNNDIMISGIIEKSKYIDRGSLFCFKAERM